MNPPGGANPASRRFLAGKTVFVTGGTGFLGGHLVEALIDAGCTSVRCLVRSDRKWLDGLPVEIVAGDLSDHPALDRGVQGADVVFHVAALTRARTWEAFERANVVGTARLLNAVAESGTGSVRVVLTSSLAVVGDTDATVADESTPLNPVSMYGRSKR
ncbi:MAG: NAD-dependent epimerase/dehydratase family protein, partial [Rhodothermales bacterium]|nr:NAD-dependent epimerase/dehydratase family protein [Rhodothermales bacterium]